MKSCAARAARQAGFTYLGILVAVSIVGVALAATGEVWQVVAKREREQELLFVGAQFRHAIEHYYAVSPGPVKRYPRALVDLVQDPRFPHTVRHLRRIYRDPISGSTEWGTVTAPDGGILGVFSLSPERPLKRARFAQADSRFTGAPRYRDWQFIATTNGVLPIPALAN